MSEGLNPATKITGAISIVIVTLFLIYLTPTVVTAVSGVNTSGWNFTGYAGASLMFGMIPFAWIGGVVLSAIAGMVYLAKH